MLSPLLLEGARTEAGTIGVIAIEEEVGAEIVVIDVVEILTTRIVMSIMNLRRATGTDPAMTATTTDTIPPDAIVVTETTTMSGIGTTTATNPNVRLEGLGARASVVASAAQEGLGLVAPHN